MLRSLVPSILWFAGATSCAQAVPLPTDPQWTAERVHSIGDNRIVKVSSRGHSAYRLRWPTRHVRLNEAGPQLVVGSRGHPIVSLSENASCAVECNDEGQCWTEHSDIAIPGICQTGAAIACDRTNQVTAACNGKIFSYQNANWVEVAHSGRVIPLNLFSFADGPIVLQYQKPIFLHHAVQMGLLAARDPEVVQLEQAGSIVVDTQEHAGDVWALMMVVNAGHQFRGNRLVRYRWDAPRVHRQVRVATDTAAHPIRAFAVHDGHIWLARGTTGGLLYHKPLDSASGWRVEELSDLGPVGQLTVESPIVTAIAFEGESRLLVGTLSTGVAEIAWPAARVARWWRTKPPTTRDISQWNSRIALSNIKR